MSRQTSCRKCPVCNKDFKPWAPKALYCSNKCQREKEYQDRIVLVRQSNNWYDGWHTPHNIRTAILREREYKCQICNIAKWQDQKVPLVLDHIDGNPENWANTNLRLICCNCDAQTPTYKGKNRGNGRFSRRKRFKEGKSY